MEKFTKGVLVFFLGLVMLKAVFPESSGNRGEPAEENAVVESVIEKEEEVSKEEVAELEVSESTEIEVVESLPKENNVQVISDEKAIGLLKDNVGELMDVEFDSVNDVIYLTPNEENQFMFLIELNEVLEGDQASLESWNAMLDELSKLSSSISDALGRPVILMLINPVNKDLSLATVADGIIVYNIAYEVNYHD